MGGPLHVALLILVPTAMWFVLRFALPWLIHRRVADSEAVLAIIAITTFATGAARTTGFPDHFDGSLIMRDPLKPLLVLVGFVFCVVAVRAYRLERRERVEVHETADEAVRSYVTRYGDHFQLYGLGLALILLGL